MVVYHNSENKFTEFDLRRARTASDIQAFFFKDGKDPYKEYGRIEYPLFLQIRNPANYKQALAGFNAAVTDDAGIKQREKLQAEGFDGVWITRDDGEMEYAELMVFSPTQIKSATANSGAFDSGNPSILFQREQEAKYKAAVEFIEDGRAILYANQAADFSSLMHELAHIMRREISGKDLDTLENWLGVEDGVWEREHEEAFAEAWEQYALDGKAPTAELQSVFDRIKEWMRKIYGQMVKAILPDEIVEVFDNLFKTEETINVNTELRVLIGEYNQQIAEVSKLLKSYDDYMGKDIEDNVKKAETVQKVLDKLKEERDKIKALEKEVKEGVPEGVTSVDSFWEKWQEDLEEEAFYQRKLEVEQFFTDIFPTNKAELEKVINQWGADVFKRKKAVDGGFRNLPSLWRSAIIKVAKGGELTDKHAQWLLANIKNNPQQFIENFMSFNIGIDEETYKMYEEWQDLQKQEKEALALAKEEAKQAEELAKTQKQEEIKLRIAEVSTMRQKLEAAAEYDDPLIKIKILTGEYTVDEIFADSKKIKKDQLFDIVKKTPEVVEKAFTEGEQQGIKEGKAIVQGQVKAKQEKKKIREYIEKLARRISKPPADTIDFYYKEAIRAIQYGIDPAFRAEKSLKSLSKIIRKNQKRFRQKL